MNENCEVVQVSCSNILQLHLHLPDPTRKLAGAGLAGFPKNGRIPDLPEPKSCAILVIVTNKMELRHSG